MEGSEGEEPATVSTMESAEILIGKLVDWRVRRRKTHGVFSWAIMLIVGGYGGCNVNGKELA